MAERHSSVRHPVAPQIRYAFLQALELKGKRDGMTLPQIMLELIDNEGLLPVMDRVAKFQEKSALAEAAQAGDITLVGILTRMAGGSVYDSSVEGEPGSLRGRVPGGDTRALAGGSPTVDRD